MNKLTHVIQRKDGKFMGAGSNTGGPEGTAWFDEPNGDVFKASKAGADVQFKHLSSRIDLTGAEVVQL